MTDDDVERKLECRVEANSSNRYTHGKGRRRGKSRSRSRRRRSRSRSHKSTRSRAHQSHRRSIRERRSSPDQLTEDEKDARTIYIWQLSLRVKTRDLENFFASMGEMDVVRLVSDNKTGRSRGVAFIQFRNVDSVNRALDLNGQKLLGIPIQIRTVSSEKCRAAECGAIGGGLVYFRGPTKLRVSNLHIEITEHMLEDIFSPYGKIDELRLMTDENGVSLSTAFIVFRRGEHAKNVVEQMNDFNLAGQCLKVSPVIEEIGLTELVESQRRSVTPSDRFGLSQGAYASPTVNSQCFVLSNMFDPSDVYEDQFCREVRDDIVNECSQFGGLCHLHVDKRSLKGEVYVKCPSIYVANKCVATLHGRSFDGRLITVNYIPLEHYHKMFPESVSIKRLLRVDS